MEPKEITAVRVWLNFEVAGVKTKTEAIALVNKLNLQGIEVTLDAMSDLNHEIIYSEDLDD
jgi:hypothetical protein